MRARGRCGRRCPNQSTLCPCPSSPRPHTASAAPPPIDPPVRSPLLLRENAASVQLFRIGPLLSSLLFLLNDLLKMPRSGKSGFRITPLPRPSASVRPSFVLSLPPFLRYPFLPFFSSWHLVFTSPFIFSDLLTERMGGRKDISYVSGERATSSC